VWRWCCPVCWAGAGDPIYRPFVIDSDGRVFAHCCQASVELLAREVQVLLGIADRLDSLDRAVMR
jgi:hypothetical protein